MGFFRCPINHKTIDTNLELWSKVVRDGDLSSRSYLVVT